MSVDPQPAIATDWSTSGGSRSCQYIFVEVVAVVKNDAKNYKVEATLNIYSAVLAANISEGGLVTPPIPWPGCLVVIDSWLKVCLMAVIPTLTMAGMESWMWKREWHSHEPPTVVFFVLTMYKFFGSIREQTGRRLLDVLRDHNNFSPILMILVWDGGVYFFL
ncbi:unnamed protein product [Cyclocybe aegerita]|uniref:Uncharacterized protein n=1 Tax=Cyclocybe aegerita TaxID=1973307 RepID=A0A8S0W9D9_CYCAE|nr:unnamed protein product [Cyclocybe aegerita]